jgi:AcrR family transcriptional regulator
MAKVQTKRGAAVSQRAAPPAKAAKAAKAAKDAQRPPVAERPAAREQRSTARREAILRAALEEFSAHGFEAARLEDVARRAGIAKGTIYLYFSDKEALFQELVRSEMLPVVGTLEQAAHLDAPIRTIAEQFIELFVREVVETHRKDVMRLVLSEGTRFPKLAEFYYREVLARALVAVRGLMQRAVARGEISGDALLRFPQLIAAPAVVAILWRALFDRFEPLDARAMLRAHFDLLFGGERRP